MSDEQKVPSFEHLEKSALEVGSLAFVIILCSEKDAMDFLNDRMNDRLQILKKIVKVMKFDEGVEFLIYLDRRFPEVELDIFERLCELAENDHDLVVLESRWENLPEEVRAYAICALRSTAKRLYVSEQSVGEQVEASEGELPNLPQNSKSDSDDMAFAI